MYKIVTLTGFPDIFNQFQITADVFEPGTERIVVTSRGVTLNLNCPQRWTVVPGVEPFIYARNANLGIQAAGRADILLVNDDVQFCGMGPIANLARIARSDPRIGILSPLVMGGVGNLLQRGRPGAPRLIVSQERLAFVCVYLKREVIDQVGLLDERFDGYGGDDDDYSHRVQRAGFTLSVTSAALVRHGFGDQRSSASFARTMGQTEASMHEMRQLLKEKERCL